MWQTPAIQHRHSDRQCYELGREVDRDPRRHRGSVAVTPNGTRAYALVVGNDEVGSRACSCDQYRDEHHRKEISVGANPYTFGFNPNGRYAYVVDGFDAATTAPNEPGRLPRSTSR